MPTQHFYDPFVHPHVAAEVFVDSLPRSTTSVVDATDQIVLLIEDGSSNTAIYGEYLSDTRYRLRRQRPQVEVLEEIGQTRPAAVILDLDPANLLGMDLLRLITLQQANCVVIVVTADASLSQAIEVMRAGAADYLIKPFSAERLATTLRNALEHSHLGRRLAELQRRRAHVRHSPEAGSDDSSNNTLRPLHEIERDAIEQAIAHCGGNIAKAAAFLEISPSTIHRKRLSWKTAD